MQEKAGFSVKRLHVFKYKFPRAGIPTLGRRFQAGLLAASDLDHFLGLLHALFEHLLFLTGNLGGGFVGGLHSAFDPMAICLMLSGMR